MLFFLVFSLTAHAQKQNLYTVYGDNSPDALGFSVSDLGDINGDGYADFIAGAYRDDINGNASGSARVYSGIDSSILHNVIGDGAGDQLGWSVSGAGDVNGDGYADFIVGAPRDNNNGSKSGMARVYSGFDASTLYTFNGDSADDEFGISVSDLGDINKDGYADVIIGAYADDNNGNNSGSARVFSGVDGAILYTVNGDSAGDNLGYSVSGAGDVNGDGYVDFIAGAWGDDNNGALSGSARVYSGVDASVIYTVDGDFSWNKLGLSVSDAGDINNDGYADFIAGAPRETEYQQLIRVYSGIDGNAMFSIYHGEYRAYSISVSGVGDVNGDGYADIVSGSNSGWASVYSGKDGASIYAIESDVGYFGASVSGAGDVDGDSYPDFLIGAYYDLSRAGSANVFSGKKLLSKQNDFTNDANGGWIWKGEANGHEGSSRTWSPDWASASPGWVSPLRTYPPFWIYAMDYDIETTGDFDGDGDADWLWRDRDGGQWKIWEIESGTRVGQTTPADFDANHDWEVIGVGDSDKDGDDDVILNNSATGEVLVWEMESMLINSASSIGTKADFGVVRLGDFDGDGDVDLLLQEQSGTTLRFWELEDNAFVQEHTTQQTGAGFSTQCAGDFNGDGNDDVYLLAANGTSKWFHYIDFVRQSQVFGASQADWIFLGCGDYDGDGDMDILWSSADGLGYNRLFINEDFNNSATFYTNRYGGTNPANPGYGFEYRGNGN